MWPYDTSPQTFLGTPPPPPLLGLHPPWELHPGARLRSGAVARNAAGGRAGMELGAERGWVALPPHPVGVGVGSGLATPPPEYFSAPPWGGTPHSLGPTAIKEIEGFCNNQDPIFQQPQSLGVLGPRPIPLGSNPRAARLASCRKDVMMPCCWHSGSTTRGPRHGGAFMTLCICEKAAQQLWATPVVQA